jgi:uncharacterized protein YecE (DUF72 family)
MEQVRAPGTAYVGTSGFAYAAWAPRFYPSGIRAAALLPEYARRLTAVELNNTFYQHPTESRIAAWVGATPPRFRFVVKAQRGGSFRALRTDAPATVGWLTAPYRLFGERLGCVLFRVGEESPRDDDALARLLDAWPRDLPITLELQHPSWFDDAVHAILRDHGAVLCATDLDAGEPPGLRRIGSFLYLRLRRADYTQADLADWAARLSPFLADGMDAYVFFRHDADGTSALRAEQLAALLDADAMRSAAQVDRS